MIEFLGKVNRSLPGIMQLDIEGFYKRGIFVTKKSGEKAAKKKYALLDEKGRIKITGFAFVRRDWAKIAKEAQKKVLEFVLKEGNPEKALEYVRELIRRVKEGRVSKEELVIYTQLTREISQYEAIGPHVAAVKKAMMRGFRVEPGSIIGYVITGRPGSISEKAELEQFVEPGDYDADYYVEHQILPVVMPILQELGYTEEHVRGKGVQTSLSQWFS